jgi:Uma2 family endonuclease
MVVQEKFYTADDLWELSHLPENSDKRLELVEGEIREMSPSGGAHGGVVSKADRFIGDYVERNQLGYVTGAETGYTLHKNPRGRDTVRAPDVGFVRAERLPDGLPNGYIPFAPDLAVEVVSPNDTAQDIHDKVQDYLRYGTLLVWVLYPKTRTAMAHTGEGAITLRANEVLDGGDVLPGFSVKLSEIFAVLGPVVQN